MSTPRQQGEGGATTGTIDAFGDAAQLLARRVGLRLDPAARRRLTRCVVEEAGEHGLETQAYVAALDGDALLLQALLNRVTVQETAFFRDPVQFEVLAEHVLPTLTPPFTIWSAGSANGQEAYSLAIVLEELGLSDARVLTTDISTRALARARAAEYSAREIGGLSEARRRRFLVPTAAGFSIAPEVTAHVDITHHNLVGSPPAPTPGTCPVVFCRNVLIYFSHDEVVTLLDRIADLLPAGGWLFLGYSESLWQVTDRFELVRLGEAFVYRRRPNHAVAVTAPTPRTHRRPARERSRVSAPERAPAGPVVAHAPPADSRVVELLAAGEAAATAGDHAAAVAAFRKCTYLDPEQPVMHLHLGLALEASGDRAAARRSFSVARAALDACDTAAVEAVLEGYPVGELARLLDRKLVEAE